MQINTQYSIGDKVKVRYLVEEFVPIVSAHIVEGVGIIDGINIRRNGISYSVYVDCDSRSYTEIVELIENADAKRISFKHFFYLNYGGSQSVINKLSKKEYSWFGFGNDTVSLDNEIVVSEQELEEQYEFKVDFNREPSRELFLEDSEYWEVEEDTFKDKRIVLSDNIDRYCNMYECTKIKKIEVQ